MKQTKEIVEKIEIAHDPKVEHHVHKERYLTALRENDGKLDEELLGQTLGFSKEYTFKIIQELLTDGKIASLVTKKCRYKVV